MRYPKLLSWKASRAQVEDCQAKAAWDYNLFIARIFGCGDDYEYLNDRFDASLRTIAFCNKQILTCFSPLKTV